MKLKSIIDIKLIKLIFYITALFLAVRNSNTEIVKLLLNYDGIDVNIRSIT